MGLLANLGLNIVKLKQYEEETEKAKEPQKNTYSTELDHKKFHPRINSNAKLALFWKTGSKSFFFSLW